jgi:hypothetical protein
MMKNPTSTKKSGRPPKTAGGGRQVSVYLPVEIIPKFKKLGSSAWLASQIRNAPEPSRTKQN